MQTLELCGDIYQQITDLITLVEDTMQLYLSQCHPLSVLPLFVSQPQHNLLNCSRLPSEHVDCTVSKSV